MTSAFRMFHIDIDPLVVAESARLPLKSYTTVLYWCCEGGDGGEVSVCSYVCSYVCSCDENSVS